MRRSVDKERDVEEVRGIVKRECGIEMVYGGVWEGRIVRCLVSCFECLSGQSRLTYFCFHDSGRFLLSGNYRVSSLTNNGVFCDEFEEVRGFWIRGQVFPGAKVCGTIQECTRLRCCSMACKDRSKR